jgi:hypothetical protein
MSGPDGSQTKRDARRDTRRAQYEMQQTTRRRERERRIRRQRLQTYAIIAGSVILFLLVVFFIAHAVIGSGGTSPSPHHGSYAIPAGSVERDTWHGQDTLLRSSIEREQQGVPHEWTPLRASRVSAVSAPVVIIAAGYGRSFLVTEIKCTPI